MFIATVTGRMWATRKSPGLHGKRLLLVTKMSGDPPRLGKETLMAVCDKIDAGIGDVVLVLDEGGSARSILNTKSAPIRTIIVGIVDQIQIGDHHYIMSSTH